MYGLLRRNHAQADHWRPMSTAGTCLHIGFSPIVQRRVCADRAALRRVVVGSAAATDPLHTELRRGARVSPLTSRRLSPDHPVVTGWVPLRPAAGGNQERKDDDEAEEPVPG